MTTSSIALSRGFASAGMEKPMADAVAEAISTHNDDKFATKQDLAEFKGELKADMAKLEGALKADMAKSEGVLKTDMARLEGKFEGRMSSFEVKMNIMLGLMMVMCAAIVSFAFDKI